MAKSKNITVAASMEPALSRRQMLTGIAAASASVAVVATPSPAKSVTVTNLPKADADLAKENPDLLQAHTDLLAARAEHQEAKAALEWLVDEWRHLWPLAPEELLEMAGAHLGHGNRETGERDIAGRYLLRDTAPLRKRLSAKYREGNPKTCFHVLTAAQAEDKLSAWKTSQPKGRNEKSLARNQAYRAQMIAKYEKLLPVAQAYEAETARLRIASGVEAAKQRILHAELKVARLASDVSYIPAFTHQGLTIKAEELLAASSLFSIEHNGVLGDVARFIQAAIDMGRRA